MPQCLRPRSGSRSPGTRRFHFSIRIYSRAGAGQEPTLLSSRPLPMSRRRGGCDLCWLPGGYPELHAGRLAGAAGFLAGAAPVRGTRPVHGECGGYMVLGRRWSMPTVFPARWRAYSGATSSAGRRLEPRIPRARAFPPTRRSARGRRSGARVPPPTRPRRGATRRRRALRRHGRRSDHRRRAGSSPARYFHVVAEA